MTPYLIDTDKLDVLEKAKAGDLDSMSRLAASLLGALYTNEDWRQAKALYTAVLERESELQPYHKWGAEGGLGMITLQDHEYQAALEWFQKAMATMTAYPIEQWDFQLLRVIGYIGWKAFVPEETLESYLGH